MKARPRQKRRPQALRGAFITTAHAAMDIISNPGLHARDAQPAGRARVRRQMIYLGLFGFLVSPALDLIIRLGNGHGPELHSPSALGYVWRWLHYFARGNSYGDSWDAMLAALFYYPVGRAFELGQIQAWICLLFSMAALAWLSGRNAMAGVLIGLICLIKPQLALFLVWGAVRREWAFVIAWGVVVLAGNLLAVAVFGWQNHLDCLRCCTSSCVLASRTLPTSLSMVC